jgi:methylase of polypeptide subunit release factors
VSLPDIARLARLTDDDLHALRDRLRAIGLDVDAVERALAPIRAIPAVLRHPLTEWHARHAAGDAGYAIRALVVGDSAPEAELARVLGAPLFERLVDAGLLDRRDDGVGSPYLLNLFGELLIFVDRLSLAGDAVMGSGPTTNALMAAAYPVARVGNALDLGCGAGVLAIVLAANAERVLGVDINPRAIALARFNARLNDVRNVEFREGDLYAPVAGTKFDLIACQPPFVARPEGAEEATFLFGGSRGDELALRALEETPAHLASGGRAVFFVDWPELEGEAPIVARVRARVDPAIDLLLLLTPPATLDEYAVRYAVSAAPDAGPRYARLVHANREHLHRLGVTAMRQSFTILRRRATNVEAPGFTTPVEIGSVATVQPSSARIGRLLATHDLLRGSEADLVATSLRIPPKTIFVTEREADDPGATVRTHARFPPRAMIQPLGLNDEAITLAQLVHQTGSIGEALAFYQRTLAVDATVARAKLLPHAREALERGLLEPAPSG